MPRPSIKQQRRDEILDAYERCIVRYGLNGATLQQVADESGLARPLLRHNVGNREALLEALLERLEERYDRESEDLIQHLPSSLRSRALIDLMFDPAYSESRHEALLYQALFDGAQEHPSLKKALGRWHTRLLTAVESELRGEHPKANSTDLRAVASGILANYFFAESMALVIDKREVFGDSKRAAQRLLETL